MSEAPSWLGRNEGIRLEILGWLIHNNKNNLSYEKIVEEAQKLEGYVNGDGSAETHNEQTLVKVRQGLINAGLGEDEVLLCIHEMQNRGVLFRERA